MVPSFAKCLNISLFTVVVLMILWLVWTSICLYYLYVNFVQEFCFQSQWRIYMKLEAVDSIFIWWAMDSEGLSFHIIELQTHTSGYIFVCESIGWNYNYLGL